ncbi:MAG TPA: Hsp20/alpha crystallin family protein [Flavisolibacter sp.]
MTLVKLNNRPLQKSFNNLMDDFFATVPSIFRDDFVTPSFRSFTPVNIKETENDYVLEVVAPGFQKDDFKINLDNNTLTISADKKEETENNNEKFIRKEFKQQSFSRSFTIDEKTDAENISAKYVNGVLTLNLAKKQEVKPPVKEISIQ